MILSIILNSIYQSATYSLKTTYSQLDLTLSRRSFLSFRNQSIDLISKPVDWFQYDRNIRRERVKVCVKQTILSIKSDEEGED